MMTETQREWIAALRSGEWKQHRKALVNSAGDAFCCLGVAQQMFGDKLIVDGKPTDAARSNAYCTIDVSDKLFDNQLNRLLIAKLNDRGWTFAEIADFLEAFYTRKDQGQTMEQFMRKFSKEKK